LTALEALEFEERDARAVVRLGQLLGVRAGSEGGGPGREILIRLRGFSIPEEGLFILLFVLPSKLLLIKEG